MLMCLLLVDIRTCFWMELPAGPPERDGQLPDRVHRVSDEQMPGRGAAPGQCELDRVHQEKHSCKSQNFKPSHTWTNEEQTYWNPKTDILKLDVWVLKKCFFGFFFQILTIIFRKVWLGPLLMARPDHRICSAWFVKPPWFSKNLWRQWQAPYAPTEKESRYYRNSTRRSPTDIFCCKVTLWTLVDIWHIWCRT